MFANELMMTGAPEQAAKMLEQMQTLMNNAEHYPEAQASKDVDELLGYAETSAITRITPEFSLLTISGMLIPQYSWMEEYLDIISYDTIRAAVDILMKDEEVTKVITVVNSPGGYARGCGTTHDILYGLAEAKEMSACFTETTLASAGYWLGCAMPMVVGSKYALVGSIGSYTIISSQYRRAEEDGVDFFVARSGDKKGIPSGVEPLTDLDKEAVTALNDAQADLFLESVSDSRSGKLTSDEWIAGETFPASKGLELGLLDSVSSLPELINVFKNIEFRRT